MPRVSPSGTARRTCCYVRHRAYVKAVLPLLLVLLAPWAQAQQPGNYRVAYELMGLSANCVRVLNFTIASCSGSLGHYSAPGQGTDLVAAADLPDLCVPQCRADLVSHRNRIKTGCTSPLDVMVFDGTPYPPTYMLESFLLTYDVSCSKDTSSGQYCDVLLASWRDSSTAPNPCADCILGPFAKQLASPIGYNADSAAQFSSITASCHAAGYTYATPTAFTVNGTVPTATPNVTVTCAGTRGVAAGDTCQSISVAAGVATFDLITRNALDMNCTKLPASVCLPDTCVSSVWSGLEDCKTVAARANVTLTQFLAWNPMFDSFCSNAAAFAGWNVCLGPPGGAIPAAPVPTAAPIPTNAMAHSIRDCAQWYTIQANDTCYLILPPGSSISLAQFLAINPDLDADCTNLWLGYAYCIRPVQPPVLNATTTFSQLPYTTAPPPSLVVPTTAPSPRASGVQTGCTLYYTPLNPTAVNTALFPRNASDDAYLLGCPYVAGFHGITLDQLLRWNPSLSRDMTVCKVVPGLSYCVGGGTADGNSTTTVGDPPTTIPTSSSGSSTRSSNIGSSSSSTSRPPTTTITSTTQRTSTTRQTSTTTTGGTAPPAQTQPGAISSCKKWHTVVSGDGCWAISNTYGITLDNFYLWNPGVGSDCSALWLDYAVCVGI